MMLRRLFSETVGLRHAASIIFALTTVLPLLALLPVLWWSGLVERTDAQVSLGLAVLLALLGWAVFRQMIGNIAGLADSVLLPEERRADAQADAVVPGLGRVAEIGQIGEAFSRMLHDLRASTERLEDLVFKLSTLTEVVELASRIPQMQDLLSLVLERTMHTVRASIGSIMLLDRERDALRVVAARGLPEGVAGAAEVPLDDSIAGKVVRLGEAVLVDDIEKDPRFAKGNDPKYGSGAFICLPVRVEDRIIGVVNLAKSATSPANPATFSPTDLQFLRTLMAHIAYALDNARLLQEAQQSAMRLRNVIDDLRTTQARAVEGETLRAIGQMASGMAHHLNNLLAVVSGRIELLLLRVTDPHLRQPLAIVHRATLDAAEVVRRVLGFTAAHPVAPAARVGLNDIVTEVVELTRPRWQDEAQRRGIAIRLALDLGEVPSVAGEAAPLREALLNLVLNALDAMPDGGDLRIATSADAEAVVCVVGDSGHGMSEEVRRRALEPFFTTKGPQGMGLGLSVAHGIVQRHRGDLTLESAPGRGATVTVRLPVADASVPAAGAGVTAAAAAAVPLRILVVDDEREVRATLVDALVEDGHAVVQAAGGREALEILERGEAVDVVMTDLGMPEMNGWEVVRAIRARWPDLPVGLVTGWAVALEMSPEERSRVDFLLSKPYTMDSVRAALATFGRRPG
jgi:signal transduction histidine kinase